MQEIDDESALFAISDSGMVENDEVVVVKTEDAPDVSPNNYSDYVSDSDEISEEDQDSNDSELRKTDQNKKKKKYPNRRIIDLNLKCGQCDRTFMRHCDMKRHKQMHMGGNYS